MIDSEIAVAVIVLIGTIGGNYILAKSNHNKLLSEFDKRLAVYAATTDGKVEELSRRVEKHNNVIERVFKLDQDTAVQTEQIKTVNHRVDDLERSAK